MRVPPEFASKVNRMFVLPVPLAKPLLRCSQGTFAVADHAADSGVVARVTLLLPAAGPSTRPESPSLNVSATAC